MPDVEFDADVQQRAGIPGRPMSAPAAPSTKRRVIAICIIVACCAVIVYMFLHQNESTAHRGIPVDQIERLPQFLP